MINRLAVSLRSYSYPNPGRATSRPRQSSAYWLGDHAPGHDVRKPVLDSSDIDPTSTHLRITLMTIVLVQDNLSTHTKASLYEAFPAAEARRLVERFEWHYTPKHGSWLDLAESELGVLSSQCLDRRIPDKQTL